jgi:hypothetical protein
MSVMWKYLDKRTATIRAMEDYENMQFIIKNTDDEVKGIRDSMVGLGSQNMDGMPHSHNPQAAEDRILDGIEKIDILKERYRQAVEYMNWFKPAWEAMNEDEQYVLEGFYLSGESDIGMICDYFGIERSSAYNRKNRALNKLATRLYGKE